MLCFVNAGYFIKGDGLLPLCVGEGKVALPAAHAGIDAPTDEAENGEHEARDHPVERRT